MLPLYCIERTPARRDANSGQAADERGLLDCNLAHLMPERLSRPRTWVSLTVGDPSNNWITRRRSSRIESVILFVGGKIRNFSSGDKINKWAGVPGRSADNEETS